jgi:hypothetical protein
MARLDVKASGLEVLEEVVTIFAPACQGLTGFVKGTQTGASAKPATGSRSWSDPVAASEQEHAQHAAKLTR